MASSSNTAALRADLIPGSEEPSASSRERRAHQRLAVQEIPWLKSVRLNTGVQLSIVDLSPGGALFETSARLGPGTSSVLTLNGEGIAEIARFKLLRCEIASIKDAGPVYRGACMFERVLQLPSVETARNNATRQEDPVEQPPAPDDAQVLALIQFVAKRAPELKSSPRVATAITHTRAALARGDSPQTILKLIEAHLRGTSQADAAAAPPGNFNAPPRLASALPAGADSAPTHGWNRIVVRYLDGRLLKGFSQDFHPGRPTFHMSSTTIASESPVLVPMQHLKAIFFVRDFAGNPDYVDSKAFPQSAQGRRIEVTFLDDEVLVGSTLGYRPDGTGFFLTPADQDGNNLRVFVLAGAIRHIRYL